MASGQFAVVYRQIDRLFRSGCVAGLTEGQLLDRFIANRDDTAFEAIVSRHGPMVLGVCRANLRDPNDVEDAFQATFLVLVKKAGSLRDRDLLGNWLYGVAHRVARRARVDAARRHLRESTGPEPVDPSITDSDRFDVRPMIHDEVNRLPESYRAAVILCLLEGRTHEEAARELGWPIGTVKGRLARAKDLLRDRLSRRGLAVPSGAIAIALAKEGRAAVSRGLIESTTSTAIAVATTPLAALSALAVSPHVITLTRGVLHTMSTIKIKLAATAIVAGLLSVPGVSAYQESAPSPKPAPATVAKPETTAKASINPAELTPAEARLKIAEEAVSRIPKHDGGSMMGDPYGRERTVWLARLQEARKEVEEARKKREGPAYPYNQAVREVAKAREVEARLEAEAKEHAARVGGGGAIPGGPFDLLDAKFRRIEAEEHLAKLSKAPRDAQAAPANVAGGGDEAGPRPGLRAEHPADLTRNKRIEDALEKIVAMNFPNETPLEDVLGYVNEMTKDAGGRTIPIYLDPIALQNTEKTITSPVTIDIDGLPLRTTLRLILKQLGLDYRIRSGLLYIADVVTFDEEENPAPKPQEPANAGGGMMGGMG